ncbi:MAG: type II and III secretion system protein, partial [Nitrospinota bacterium]
IRLRVTPKINRDNFVSLAIDQEYSTVLAAASGSDVPVNRRQAVTNVIVKDKETLIIGGLIRKDKGSGGQGIPFLYKIPLLGWLFGSKGKTNSGTEVLIFITPTVVNNPDEARNLTEEFRKKMKELKLSVLTGKNSGDGKEKGEKTIMSN